MNDDRRAPRTSLQRDRSGRAAPPTHLQTEPPSRSSYRRVNLPPGLAETYEVEKEIPARGAEADLLVVRHRASGVLRVAKLYRPPLRPGDELMRQLASADPRHVTEAFERGDFDGTWCEVMEYCEPGSLADLMAREGPLPAPLVQDIVAEIVAALVHVHGAPIGITHRDLKPSNVLVRSRTPLDLVLADFGRANVLGDLSRIMATSSRTYQYAAPEAQFGKVSPKLDWFSLGITVVEMLIGHRPFSHDTGDPDHDQMLTESDFATKPVDLSGIEDERLLLLCRGLTIRDPDLRWGDAQVLEWRQGGSPAVREPATTKTRPVSPMTFRSPETGEPVDIVDPAELADAMGVHWDEALACVSNSRDHLRERRALRDFLFSARLERADAVLLSSEGDEEDRLLRLRLELDPDADPYFRGHLLSDERLRWWAQRAVSGDGWEFVSGLLAHDVLRLYANVPERETWRAIDNQWHENVRWIRDAIVRYGRDTMHVDDLRGELGGRLYARILRSLLDPAVARKEAAAGERSRRDRVARRDQAFAAMLAATANGPEPARHVLTQLLHDSARDHRKARRPGGSRRPLRRVLQILGVALTVLVVVGVITATTHSTGHPATHPGGPVSLQSAVNQANLGHGVQLGSDSSPQLGGEQLSSANSVVFEISQDVTVGEPPAQLSLPVRGYSRFTASLAGLEEKSTCCGSRWTLQLFRDNTLGNPVFSATFQPLHPQAVSVPLQGSSTLIFRWTYSGPAYSPDDEFVFKDGTLTSR